MFDALGTRPCEARVNLGILRDRQGESKKALEFYKQAKACGARAPKLAEWIDVKERLFGGGPVRRLVAAVDVDAVALALAARRRPRMRARRTSRSRSPSTRPTRRSQSGTDRFAFINRLAQQMTSVAGVPATGKAFARAADLEAAIKNKQVDFAVIDGVYLAERGVPYAVLATATSGGDTAPKWALFSSRRRRVDELQGKKLSHGVDGRRATPSSSRTRSSTAKCRWASSSPRSAKAPDIAAAVAPVSLHKADAVFAPESQGKGLKKLFDVRDRVPNPAFCEVGSRLRRRGGQGQAGGARPRRRRPRARRLEAGRRRRPIARSPDAWDRAPAAR